MIALDWTEWPKDEQTACAANQVKRQGRATFPIWKTVKTSVSAGQQTQILEDQIERLQDLISKERS